MSDPYFQNLFAERIGGANYGKGTEIYKFEKIKRAKRAAIAEYPDRELLDFGIGENDDVADPIVVEAMRDLIGRPENRGYADNGIQEFKNAAANWMHGEFGVALDPTTEVNHCIGSKTALSMFPGLFINEGDVALMTVPGYPVAGTHTKYYGGEVYSLPLLSENNFLPDLKSIPQDICDRAKILIINYPNSPTGALATKEFFLEVVDFAKKHNIVVVNDAAHIVLTYPSKPMSFLSIDGAKDVGVEIHSLSKGFNMIGWRIGFVAGNERIVRAFSDFKDNCDSGQFIAIQKAAVKALENPSIGHRVKEKYERRLRKLVEKLKSVGFKAEMPGGTYFLYVPSPKGLSDGTEFKNAEEVSQYLIKKHSICTVPWNNAGEFLRFSVTFCAETILEEDKLLERLVERLSTEGFVF